MALNNCLSVSLKSMDGLSDPSNIFRKNGVYNLDLEASEALSLTKKVEELDQSSNIETAYITGISLPATGTNNYALFRNVNPNVVDQSFPPIGVYLRYGSNYYMDADMYVRKYQAGNGTGAGSYEVDFKPIVKHWAASAKDLKLNTLPYNDFEWTEANVLDIIENEQSWDEAGEGFYFPLVWYGRKYIGGKRDNRIAMQDFRPLFYATDILKKGLCKIGWQFESPLLYSEHGRGYLAYILDKDYMRRPEDLEVLKFKGNIGENGFNLIVSQPATYNKIIFDVEIFDNGNNYDPANSVFSGAGIHTFFVTLKVQLRYANTDRWNQYPQNVFEIVLERADGEIVIYAGYDSISPNPANDVDHQWEDEVILAVSDVPVELGDKVYVRYRFLGGTGFWAYLYQTATEGTFYNEPKQLLIYPGFVANFADWIHPDYTLLDFIKGIAHPIQAKFDTDFINKRVTMYTPYDVEFHGEQLEGFYTDSESKDYNLNQLVGSESIDPYNILSKRYLRLQWADSTDAYIESLQFSDESPPFSRTLDLGERYEDTDPEVRANPFFEPTINRTAQHFAPRNPPEVPWLVDNMDGELSFDIGPRLLWTPGKKKGRYKNTGTEMWAVWKFYFGKDYPMAWQVMENEVEFTDGWRVPEQVVAYGRYKYDFYRMFWRRWVLDYTSNFQIGANLLLSHPEFNGFNFRARAVLRVKGRDVVGRIQSVTGWNPCETVSARVVMLPERQFSDPCEDLADDEFDVICAGNMPTLEVSTYEGGGACYEFSLGGTSSSPVEDILFEYAYNDDPDTWIEATFLCPATGPFSVRMKVTYSDLCPPVVIVRSFNPCSNQPVMSFEYDDEGECIVINITNTGTSTIDWTTTTIETSPNPNGPWNDYTPGTCVSYPDGTMYIQANVTFTDGCPPILLTGQWEFFIQQALCNAVWGFECVDEGGFITWNLFYPYPVGPDGVVQLALDIIKWRLPGEGEDDWRIWDGQTPIPCPVEAMRVIIFCDDACPVYCSPVVVCCTEAPPETTEAFEAGCP